MNRRTIHILNLLFLFTVEIITAQDTLSIKEIYFDNNIAYKDSNDQLFTGVAQKLRKNSNGHIVSEEIYKDGVILEWRSYFGKSNRRLAEKVMYFSDHPLMPKERIQYRTNKNGSFIERTFFNLQEEKTLNTIHKDTTLVYKMPYVNGKKNGQEFCFDDEGNPMIIKFINGKKVEKQ